MVTKNDLREVTRLNNKSLDDLQKVAKLRRIKNIDDMSKEDLIYTLLRPEKNILEDNYMKYINNNTDNELHARINNVRVMASKLGNILTKEERNFIRKELYKLQNKKRFTKTQRERAYVYLIELVNTLNNKEKHQYSNFNDQDYFRIKGIENLFDTIDLNEYYKSVLTKEVF